MCYHFVLLKTPRSSIIAQPFESLLPQIAFDAGKFIKAFGRSLLDLVIRLMAGPFKPVLKLGRFSMERG